MLALFCSPVGLLHPIMFEARLYAKYEGNYEIGRHGFCIISLNKYLKLLIS